MINSFFGFKKDQVQAFNQKGRRVVVSRILALPLKIRRSKSEKRDGYQALVVEVIKDQKKKEKKNLLREIRLGKPAEFKPGGQIKLTDVFKTGDQVQVQGITKGRGFAGVMKRWGFKGGPRTHGQSDRKRAPGSIGQRTDPGRVWKGKKMPGRMGSRAKTIKGLTVYKIDEKKQELWLKGLVPGAEGGLIKISKQIKPRK